METNNLTKEDLGQENTELNIKKENKKSKIKSTPTASIGIILHPIRSKRILIKIFNICFLIVQV